ncbi:MAG: CYTH domain-containing protein [Clostridia bacterium]|nr:CYTH domain-containing protein [Clostridia bacterium]
MNIELEERILEIDVKKMIAKLESLGAEKVGEWHQKRYVYDFNPIRENEWIRLRTNGITTTLTYKNVEKNEIDGTKEHEIEVENFEKTNEMLKILGYLPKAFQENKRIRYLLKGTEVDLDSWPLIPPYLEIEGKSKSEIEEIEKLLEVDKSKVTYLNCSDVYKEIYGIDISKIKELKF